MLVEMCIRCVSGPFEVWKSINQNPRFDQILRPPEAEILNFSQIEQISDEDISELKRS